MGTYDNRSGHPLSSDESYREPSKEVGRILELLEAHGVPAAVNEEIVAIVESLEADIERLYQAKQAAPAAPATVLQQLAHNGYLTPNPGGGFKVADKARDLLAQVDKTVKDQLIDEYVDLIIEVGVAISRQEPFVVTNPEREERYEALGNLMTKADFLEIRRRCQERFRALGLTPPPPTSPMHSEGTP